MYKVIYTIKFDIRFISAILFDQCGRAIDITIKLPEEDMFDCEELLKKAIKERVWNCPLEQLKIYKL